MVPEGRDRARQRAGRRRSLRALRNAVEQRKLEQWFFRITDYAERLLADFDQLEAWPEHVITMQRNWIGRSEGAEVTLDAKGSSASTSPSSRPARTRCSVPPSSCSPPSTPSWSASSPARRPRARSVSTSPRPPRVGGGPWDEDREKTGVALGRSVVNPVNGEEIPMFVADYVLMEYGTGAIMAVPGHDARDYEFARAFDLPVRRVIEGEDPDQARDEEGLPYAGDGPMTGSGRFDGKGNREAYAEIVEWLGAEGRGEPAVNYRLRDWLVSRQRYWGAPIPVVYCEDAASSRCPTTSSGRAAGGRRLRAAGQEPAGGGRGVGRDRVPACGGPAGGRPTRWTPSSTPPGTSSATSTPATTRRRGTPRGRPLAPGRPVHRRGRARDPAPDVRALLHQGAGRHRLLGVQEPFANLFAQGMITRDGAKMSKSRGNTVVPAEYVERYGADTARTYICFMGPPERGGDWSDEGVEGVNRFLSRLWRLCEEVGPMQAGEPAEPGGEPRRGPGCSPRRTGRSTRRPATSSAASSSTPRSPR